MKSAKWRTSCNCDSRRLFVLGRCQTSDPIQTAGYTYHDRGEVGVKRPLYWRIFRHVISEFVADVCVDIRSELHARIIDGNFLTFSEHTHLVFPIPIAWNILVDLCTSFQLFLEQIAFVQEHCSSVRDTTGSG